MWTYYTCVKNPRVKTFNSDVLPVSVAVRLAERERVRVLTAGTVTAYNDLALQLHIMMSAGEYV